MKRKVLYLKLIVIIILISPFFISTLAQKTQKAKSLLGTSYSGSKQPLKELVSQYGNARAIAPANWRITGARPEGDALDVMSSDKTMAAGYLIQGVQGSLTTGPYAYMYKDPDTFLDFFISDQGKCEVEYGEETQDEFGYYVLPYELRDDPTDPRPVKGVVFYKIFPVNGDPRGYIILMRNAKTYKNIWEKKGAEAIAVALSIRCNVQQTQNRSYGNQENWNNNYGTTNRNDNRSSYSRDSKAESSYNVQLGMEDVHDPDTGENYWMSPSTDWDENGPDGPGYYDTNGNDVKKLELGRDEE